MYRHEEPSDPSLEDVNVEIEDVEKVMYGETFRVKLFVKVDSKWTSKKLKSP